MFPGRTHRYLSRYVWSCATSSRIGLVPKCSTEAPGRKRHHLYGLRHRLLWEVVGRFLPDGGLLDLFGARRTSMIRPLTSSIQTSGPWSTIAAVGHCVIKRDELP